jgi:hypothetical protein
MKKIVNKMPELRENEMLDLGFPIRGDDALVTEQFRKHYSDKFMPICLYRLCVFRNAEFNYLFHYHFPLSAWSKFKSGDEIYIKDEKILIKRVVMRTKSRIYFDAQKHVVDFSLEDWMTVNPRSIVKDGMFSRFNVITKGESVKVIIKPDNNVEIIKTHIAFRDRSELHLKWGPSHDDTFPNYVGVGIVDITSTMAAYSDTLILEKQYFNDLAMMTFTEEVLMVLRVLEKTRVITIPKDMVNNLIVKEYSDLITSNYLRSLVIDFYQEEKIIQEFTTSEYMVACGNWWKNARRIAMLSTFFSEHYEEIHKRLNTKFHVIRYNEGVLEFYDETAGVSYSKLKFVKKIFSCSSDNFYYFTSKVGWSICVEEDTSLFRFLPCAYTVPIK